MFLENLKRGIFLRALHLETNQKGNPPGEEGFFRSTCVLETTGTVQVCLSLTQYPLLITSCNLSKHDISTSVGPWTFQGKWIFSTTRYWKDQTQNGHPVSEEKNGWESLLQKWVIIMDRRQDSNATLSLTGKSGRSAQGCYCTRGWGGDTKKRCGNGEE